MRAESYRVLIALGTFADADGRCFPSLVQITGRSEVDRRHVHRATRQLIDAGLLRVERRPSARNVYTLIGVATGGDSRVATGGDSRVATGGDSRVATGGDSRVATGGTREKITSQSTSQSTSQQHVRAARASVGVEWFDEFWRVYPSRGRHANPRKPAQSKFAELVRRGLDPQKMIAAAVRYAAATADLDERRYIAQAVTWLRQERYEDQGEAAAPVHPSSRAGSAAGRSDQEWREIMKTYVEGGARWSSWPPGCWLPPQKGNASRVPETIRREFGFD
jgi:hypothetical protein